MNQPACHSDSAANYPTLSAPKAVLAPAHAALLHQRNTPRRRWATSAALTLLLCTTHVPGRQAHAAYPPVAPQPENLQPLTIEAPKGLTPDLALACFSVLESWIREGKEPSVDALPPGADVISAACITLRLDGAIVGRGDALRTPGELPSNSLHPLVAAAKSAHRESQSRLAKGGDAFREDRKQLFAGDIQISLELAEAIRPITLLSFDEADLMLARGLDGVAVRIGDRVEATYPSATIERELSPGAAIAACTARASGNPELGIRTNPVTQPPALAKTHQAVFYAFRPVHLAQTAPHEPARFLHRGGRVVQPRDLSMQAIQQWADGIALRLMDITIVEAIDDTKPPHPDAEGRICLRLPGTYSPSTGTHEPALATIRQQGLVAAALARFAQTVERRDRALHERSRNVAVRLLRDVLEHVPGGPPNVDSDEAAVARDVAFQMLHGDLVYEQSFRPWHEKQGLTSVTRWDQVLIISKLKPLEEKSPSQAISWQSRGELALALALRKDALAGDHVRDIFRKLTVTKLHEAMPWAGYAQLQLATADDFGPAAAILREWREDVYARMMPPAMIGSDNADLAGGIPASRNSLPTAESARSVAFLAKMLGDTRLTDRAEFSNELSRLLSALRFLRQLTIDEFGTYSAANPKVAIWGIKRAPWDQRLDPENAAITLFALCETLDAISPRPAPAANPERK
jgi:hypothetical protein